MIYKQLEQALEPYGLICRGGFTLIEDDGFASMGSLVLIGNAGSAMWDVFASSEADQAGALATASDNPMDEWTQRIIDPVAGQFHAAALYPFDGPPYYPFQRWAMRAEAVFASPTGPLVHPVFGLWHAYRAALIFDHVVELPKFVPEVSPCQTCLDKPCLTACPVDAFLPNFYDVPACVRHLQVRPQTRCRTNGCLARHVCPLGQNYAYSPDQAVFHMGKFVRSRLEPAK